MELRSRASVVGELTHAFPSPEHLATLEYPDHWGCPATCRSA